ncbi:MAG TPA: hypothetical protein VFE62_15145 [Gemmataceae bacterium]|nr:hypothetical protein [Gemmataceae bacterium]
MLGVGIAFLVIGVLWSAFKGWVVWDIAHDLYGGGGAPTLDFPLFCPMPLAMGARLVLSALDAVPFPGFGFSLYVGLAIAFGLMLWWFDRIGAPTRQRQLIAIQQRSAAESGEQSVIRSE